MFFRIMSKIPVNFHIFLFLFLLDFFFKHIATTYIILIILILQFLIKIFVFLVVLILNICVFLKKLSIICSIYYNRD